MEVVIFSDGGSRGNPGPAAYGAVLYEKNEDGALEIISELSEYIGETTNNQAEYKGVIAGLTKAKEVGATSVIFNMDSELIAKQLTMKYKVKKEELQPLFLKAWNLMQELKNVTIQHVPREKNTVADALVNKALDSHM